MIDDKVKVCFLTANKSIYGAFIHVSHKLKEIDLFKYNLERRADKNNK